MWRLKFSTVKLSSSNSNPRCLTPCVSWNKWIVRLDDGSLARVGSLGIMWLWCQWWVCLIHPERWAKHLLKLDKAAYDNHVNLLRDPRTRDFVRKLPGDDKLIAEFEMSGLVWPKDNIKNGSEVMGVAAYSNDSNSPKANFSSKKVFDKYDNEIQFGDFVRVDGKVVVQVFEDGTGDLVFSPYGKEDLVRAYWMNSLEVVRPIGSDGLCCCNCGTSCPLGKAGMGNRCSESELSGSGKIVVNESEVKK